MKEESANKGMISLTPMQIKKCKSRKIKRGSRWMIL